MKTLGLRPWDHAQRDAKRLVLEHVLACTGGNVTKAAAALGIQRTYAHRLVRDLGARLPHGPRFRGESFAACARRNGLEPGR